MARPTSYTEEIADKICEQIVSGMSLRRVCEAADMPHASTVFRWLAKDENKAFREQYTRACEERTEAYVEEIFDIADDGRNDWMERTIAGKTETVVNQEALNRSRLRVDARKWYASKMKPKKYGDYLRTENKDEVKGDIQLKWLDD